MIYTVTCNPAIDYTVRTEKMQPGCVNTASTEQIRFGGKGINVSLVLHELGISSTAMGFVAGFTGDAIEHGLAERGIITDFVHLASGFSRINVKITAEEETELNGRGPEVDAASLKSFFDRLDKLKDGDILVLAGSIPASLPDDVYGQILERISDRQIRTVVDARGELLLNVLKYKPFLIKPNHHELGEIFGVDLMDSREIAVYAGELHKMGACNVLVSMAENGALLLDENGEIHQCGVCKGKLKNSIGAGDSMVAGFLAGCSEGDYDYALHLGTAAGGATAFSDGLAVREKILRLLAQL